MCIASYREGPNYTRKIQLVGNLHGSISCTGRHLVHDGGIDLNRASGAVWMEDSESYFTVAEVRPCRQAWPLKEGECYQAQEKTSVPHVLGEVLSK